MGYVKDHQRCRSCIEPSGLNLTGATNGIQRGSRWKEPQLQSRLRVDHGDDYEEEAHLIWPSQSR